MTKKIYLVTVFGSTNKVSRSFEKSFNSDDQAIQWGKTEEVLLGFKVQMKYLRDEMNTTETVVESTEDILEPPTVEDLSVKETQPKKVVQEFPKRGRPSKNTSK